MFAGLDYIPCAGVLLGGRYGRAAGAPPVVAVVGKWRAVGIRWLVLVAALWASRLVWSMGLGCLLWSVVVAWA